VRPAQIPLKSDYCFGQSKGVEPAQIHCAGQWGVEEGGEVGRGRGGGGR